MLNEGKKPACISNQCEIQDIMRADDAKANQRIVDAFIQIESMGDSSAYQDIQRKLVTDSGLSSIDATTLFKMKLVFLEYRNSNKSGK